MNDHFLQIINKNFLPFKYKDFITFYEQLKHNSKIFITIRIFKKRSRKLPKKQQHHHLNTTFTKLKHKELKDRLKI